MPQSLKTSKQIHAKVVLLEFTWSSSRALGNLYAAKVWEFCSISAVPGGVGEGSSIAAGAAQVATVVRIWSLAQWLHMPWGSQIRKKKNLDLWFPSCHDTPGCHSKIKITGAFWRQPQQGSSVEHCAKHSVRELIAHGPFLVVMLHLSKAGLLAAACDKEHCAKINVEAFPLWLSG